MNVAFRTLPAAVLFAGLCLVGIPRARADLIVSLIGVTFGDGGTASGYFTLNDYGYLETASITTTGGTTLGDATMLPDTYSAAGSSVPNSPAFDTIFDFNDSADAFSLALVASTALAPGSSGADQLVPGSDTDGTLAGSVQDCQENPSTCNGATYLDGRLVTAGELYIPEPASLGIVAAGAAGLAFISRRPKGTRGAA